MFCSLNSLICVPEIVQVIRVHFYGVRFLRKYIGKRKRSVAIAQILCSIFESLCVENVERGSWLVSVVVSWNGRRVH